MSFMQVRGVVCGLSNDQTGRTLVRLASRMADGAPLAADFSGAIFCSLDCLVVQPCLGTGHDLWTTPRLMRAWGNQKKVWPKMGQTDQKSKFTGPRPTFSRVFQRLRFEDMIIADPVGHWGELGHLLGPRFSMIQLTISDRPSGTVQLVG